MRKRFGFRRAFRLGGGDVHDEVAEEFAFHVERLTEDLVAEGWDVEEARAEAARRFGSAVRFGEECRRIEEEGEGRMMLLRALDVFRQDVWFAVRQMARRPLATGLALATLTIGVTATALVYSVVDAVVLQPLPFDAPDELVRIRQVTPQGRSFSVSDPNFVDFRARQRSFVDIGGIGWGSHTLTGGAEAESVRALRMSHTILPVLGLDPVLGRNFTAEEDVKDGPALVLLSEGTWIRRFGAAPDVIGRTITLDGTPREIIGVVASERAWPGVEVFAPLQPEPVLDRGNSMIEVLGRLAPGVTLADARADMERIGAELSTEYADLDGWGATVVTLREMSIGDRMTRLGYFLLAAVSLMLLMACVSISNLQVARATSRLREMGVRAALGAGRRRIAAQLATEGMLVAVVGAGLAMGITYWALPLVRRLGPSDVARLTEASVDGPVLAVALVASLATVLVSGLAPLALVMRSGLFDALRSGAVHVAGAGNRLRDGLVVSQFALAVVVVIGAGLVTRSFVRLQDVDLGFEPDGMVRFSVRLPAGDYPPETRPAFLERLHAELGAIPGVIAVGATQAPMFSPFRPSNFVAPSENEPDHRQDFVPVSWRAIEGDLFAAAGIRLLRGRTFTPADRPPEDPDADLDGLPVIIDQALAAALFPDGSDPVGRPVTWNQPGGFQARVVGVVRTARDEFVDADPRPRIYLPYAFAAWAEPAILVRTEGDPAALIGALRTTVAAVDPDVPVIEPREVHADFRDTVAWPRFTMQVLSAFGVLALLLAAMGIYGVTAFTVARRRQEIGVRVALGARPGEVVGMVLRGAMGLAFGGVVLGLLGAAALTRLLESLLYDVSVTDPLTFLMVPLVLAVVAAVAALAPARRAVRVDPKEALTAE